MNPKEWVAMLWIWLGVLLRSKRSWRVAGAFLLLCPPVVCVLILFKTKDPHCGWYCYEFCEATIFSCICIVAEFALKSPLRKVYHTIKDILKAVAVCLWGMFMGRERYMKPKRTIYEAQMNKI